MDIDEWLRRIGLSQYKITFQNAKIDSEILHCLTDPDLQQLGIALGDRKRILSAISEFTKERSAGRPQTPREATVAERRQLTLMFCDLVGSTELSTRLDPEDMSLLIRSYQQVVEGVAARFGENVAKWMGDGALMYFGYPIAHEDDPERAVRAGLDIAAAVRTFGKDRGIPLEVRVGIATGLVVVGDLIGSGESQERGVVGDTPNLASRLQAVARAGEVVVSNSTRRLLGEAFELRSLGLQALKGFEAPVPVWVAVGEVENITRFEALRVGALTPFVGRKEEMNHLEGRCSLARQGNGQVVLLSGDAGIGKSRLLTALRERLGHFDYVSLRYQCSPHHINTPFYPIITQIRYASGLTNSDSGDVKLDKLEAMVKLSGLVPYDSVPYLANLLSIPFGDRYPQFEIGPSEIRDRTIDILIELFIGLAKQRLVVAFWEDVHWTDPTTLELFGRLIDRLTTTSAMLVITFRPEFQPSWPESNCITHIELNRFNERQTLELIDCLTEGIALPADLAEDIVAKTDGVPLFIEEITKAVLESGVLREESGSYVVTNANLLLTIPTTLQDSLTARLDRLAPVRLIAQTGAAIGREFSYNLLEAVSPVKGRELDEALDQLTAAELIYGRGTPPQSLYIFKHALVQDAAYASLLRSSRQRIHMDIARALVERFSDQIETTPEIVAHHYTHAGLIRPAIRYWLAAAEFALARSANREGARYAEKGLALIHQLGDDPDRVELELSLQVARANAALALKGYTAAETVEILNLVKSILDTGIGTDVQRFSILYGLWASNYVAARIVIAHELGREYLKVATRNGDKTFLMIGQRIVGAGLIASGRHKDGLIHLLAAEQHYDQGRHRPLSYRFGQDIGLSVQCHKVWAWWFLGRFKEARHLTDSILDELPTHGHAITIAFCILYGAIFPYLFAGEFEKVNQYAVNLVEHCTKQKAGPHYVAAGRLCIAVSGGIANPALEVFPIIREQLDMLHRFGVYVLDSPISAAIVEIYLKLGDLNNAQEILDEAIAFAETSGELYWLPELYRLRGRVDLRLRGGDPEPMLRRAYEIALRQGAIALGLRALNDMISFLPEHGFAADQLMTFLNLFDRHEMSPELTVAKTHLPIAY